MTFNHLKQKDPAGRVVSMPMPEIAPGAAISVVHAGQSNTRYYDAVLLKATKRIRTNRGVQAVTTDMVAQTRNEDRDLFGQFIVKGWTGIKDDEGNDVPYSVPHAKELMHAMPDWMFDTLQQFAQDPKNFFDDPPATDAEAEELAGN